MSGTARTTGRIRALTLAAVVLAATTGALPNQSTRATAAPLTAGSDFTISSTISSSDTSAEQPALLYPGVTRYLWFTVTNPLPEPITVTGLGIERIDAPASCPMSNLELGDPTFSGELVVPAGSSLTVPVPKAVALIDLPDVNQDACKNVTFNFTFTGTGWYSDSPTPVGRIATATVVAPSPHTAALGTPVTVVARVLPETPAGSQGASSGAPTGMVEFYLTTAKGRETLLGTGVLGADGSASLRIASLPPGAGRLHAVYRGTEAFAGSTSPAATVSIVAPPSRCTARYTTSIIGTPDSPIITGTSGNDFIYAVGADYRITAGKGHDCLVVGDGDNVISDGSGADVVIAGNGRNVLTMLGSRNVVVVGNGSGNTVTIRGTRKGKKVRRTNANVVITGDGAGNRVTVGKGSKNRINVGGGARNRVIVKGSSNRVSVGSGTANRVTVGRGTGNRITVGNGAGNRITTKGTRATVILGKGKRNQVVVRAGSKPRTTCSLPAPPRTWRGTPRRYYRDSLTRCRVVTR